MNDKLAKGLAQSFKRHAGFLFVAGVLPCVSVVAVALQACGGNFTIGPIVQVSKDPDSLENCDTGFRPPGNMNFSDQFETRVAVDPTNPLHLIATWVGHDLQANFVGVSFDGGTSWQETALPGTSCTGGAFIAAVDPYLHTIAPNGDIYLASVGFSGSSAAILATKSTDGGLTWTLPTTIDRVTGASTFDDKPSTTADPTDPLTAYVVFERTGNSGIGTTFFSRTTDGGRTWETARQIANPGSKNANTGHKLFVLPDGSLLLFFTHEERHGGGTYTTSLATLRSNDRGVTWLPITGPLLGPEIKSINPADPTIGATDPDTGVVLNEFTAAIAFAAVDRRTGALYAVWEDSRFSEGQYNSIAFAQSLNGGLTWSEPIAINRTPNDIPPADRQSFRPSIAVAADGTIGVTYYDFRFNDSSPGTLTDYWFVSMRPSLHQPATDVTNWRDEVRLTDSSFDLQAAAIFDGEFVGDSDGLATAGEDFVAVWSMPAGTDQGNIYFRRVTPREQQ
jgi:hypothetical protein